MIELFEAAKHVTDFFEKKKWDYAFIGGIAVLRWGDIRTTADVDVAILTRYEDEEHFVSEILKKFIPRISDAHTFALQNRVVLAKAENGIGIDISLGGLPFEEQMVEKSSNYCFAQNYTLRTCSAEDLIVFKAFAGRHKDWSDIDSILVKQKGNVDLDYILSHLVPLCELKEDSETVRRLLQMAQTK